MSTSLSGGDDADLISTPCVDHGNECAFHLTYGPIPQLILPLVRWILLNTIGILKELDGNFEDDVVLCFITPSFVGVPFESVGEQCPDSIVLVTSSHCNLYASEVHTRSSMRSQLRCMIFSMSSSAYPRARSRPGMLCNS